MAQMLLFFAILFAAAEFLTRRTPATLRWLVLASAWGVMFLILVWMVGEG
jgi:hypothetical protein